MSPTARAARAAATPVITWARAFPAVPAQVAEARRFLAGLLDGDQGGPWHTRTPTHASASPDDPTAREPHPTYHPKYTRERCPPRLITPNARAELD